MPSNKQKTPFKEDDIAFLHKQECNACPLNKPENTQLLKNPHMDPAGSEQPFIYMLGEAPGKVEDQLGIPFVGPSGEALHFRIPEEMEQHLRWSNVVRTRPPGNRNPVVKEIECCRPSVERDIERTKPKAIFGFGNVPLEWALKQTGITKWNGRRIPIKIRSHKCWFYPMLHPSFIIRQRRDGFEPTRQDQYGSEYEFTFARDLDRAFHEVFNSRLPEPHVHTKDSALHNVEWVTGSKRGDLNRVIEFLQQAASDNLVGIDYETNRLRPYADKARILSAAVARKESTLAWPHHHPEAEWSRRDLETLEEVWADFLHHSECRKTAHMLAFELEWSAYNFGSDCVFNNWDDSITQAWVLDERRGTHSLNFLCLQYFGFDLKALSDLDRNKLAETPLDDVLPYNALDAKFGRKVFCKQAARIREEGLEEVYEHMLRRVPTMVLTQLKGVPVDQEVVDKFYKQYSYDLRQIEKKIADLPITQKFKKIKGTDYRPSAPFDIRFVLSNIMHKRLEGGVTEAELAAFKDPIVTLTLKWRKANKNLSTYVKPLKAGHEHSELFPDGLLHPQIKTTDTRTSRTSSDNPNIQNFPKRQTKVVRSQVRVADDLWIVAYDYAGIQARNVAMESNDRKLVKAFWDRYDIHSDWMQRCAKICRNWLPKNADPETLKKFRHLAKNQFVFPSFFGAGPKSMHVGLGISLRDCERLAEQFWSEFSDIKGWQKRIVKDYYKTGYVTGVSGVRRRAPIGHNELINAPIQADEAFIVCEAMGRLSRLGDPRFQATLMVHDDLTFVWPKKDLEKNTEVVVKELLRIEHDWINVPLEVEMSIGQDWAELKEVAKFASDTWNGKVTKLAA